MIQLNAITHFGWKTEGGVAIELALVLPILIALIIGLVQVGLVGMMSNSLDSSMVVAARMIRTGRSDGPADGAGFKTLVCAQLPVSSADCGARLSYGVQKFDDFASAQAGSSGALSGQFDKGGPGDVILVRATYRLALFPVPLAPLPNEIVLDARTTFKNEPYA
jgi:Flp pilus assembly protein TadG